MQVYFAGEVVMLDVDVDNPSKKAIKDITVSLRQNGTFNAYEGGSERVKILNNLLVTVCCVYQTIMTSSNTNKIPFQSL